MALFVSYLRVSTAKQGRSGLGLDAQRAALEQFLTRADQIAGEYVETQSGNIDSREQLWKAIQHAKRIGAKLLIAKLDRFSRRVSFIASVMEQGIGLVVAEMPHATDFQLHIFAALAQEERRLISERTRAALHQAKRRGVMLGTNGRLLADRNRSRANDFARSLEPVIAPLLNSGKSLSAIARTLNELGISTAQGKRFFPETISGIVKRLRPDELPRKGVRTECA